MVTAQNPAGVSHEHRRMINKARQQTDALFDIVRPDAIYDRPIPERHRMVFYVGHLEAFDWNLLNHRLFNLDSINPDFDRLFAFGIDPVGGGLPTDQPSDWPAIEKVQDYVHRVREKVDSKLEAAEFTSSNPENDPDCRTRPRSHLPSLLYS